MGHQHSHHHHSDSTPRLALAMAMTGLFMAAEVIGGWLSGSLALIADAAHMLTDTAALGIALFAARTARRPPDGRRSYGYHRAEVLAAFVNGLVLLGIVAWILVEALNRLQSPQPVQGPLMLVVAGLGLIVNLVVLAILHGGNRQDLNLRGALLHVLGDLLGSVAALAAATVIITTGWYPIDPLLSVLVGGIILHSAWGLMRESGHILLEGSPGDLDLPALRRELTAQLPEVRDVHHVHAWSLKPGFPLLTLHVTVDEETDGKHMLAAIKSVLRERYGIEHATIQIETGHCPDIPEEDCGHAHH